MNKIRKKLNLEEGHEALERLVAWDYEVQAFSDVHIRINDRLDVWPSTKRWFDKKTFRKGSYEDLESFVKSHLPKG